MSQYMFCSEVELGSFLGSVDVIPDAFLAISETSTSYKLHPTPSGIHILAFNCVPHDTEARFLNRELGLVSSGNHQVVDFISTKVNPSFLINQAAVGLFEGLVDELKDLENQLVYKPLVVTGRSLGGYVAILFTLWLQHAIDAKEADGTKRPICITFGSPLVGDEALQLAISERPLWKSSFLNVVAKTDPVASFFLSKDKYKPFGTFLFCTESGGHSAFEDQDAVLAVLDTMAASGAGSMGMPKYGPDLQSIRRKVLYRGVSEFDKSCFNPLREGIRWQLREVGVVDEDLIGKMEAKQARIMKSKRNVYEPTRKLNEMKISLTYMEWYMKTRRSRGGYYDRYKNAQGRDEIEGYQKIVMHHRRLNQYWKKFVEEKDRMPQKEGGKLRKRWLYSGTNYRRIVEPLDIAEYYRMVKGKKDYLPDRASHYKLLEKWWNEDQKDVSPRGGKKKTASLSEDSCFWAHVENALISLKELKNGSNSNADVMKQELEKFEAYVMGAIKNQSVSSEIFLEGSSLMKWWNEYKEYKGTSYVSEFARYMNDGSYRSYQ